MSTTVWVVIVACEEDYDHCGGAFNSEFAAQAFVNEHPDYDAIVVERTLDAGVPLNKSVWAVYVVIAVCEEGYDNCAGVFTSLNAAEEFVEEHPDYDTNIFECTLDKGYQLLFPLNWVDEDEE